MLLTHAIALAEARTYLAALANVARTLEAAGTYERALNYLDAIHGNDVPALDTPGLIDEKDALHALAEGAIDELTRHGVDALQVELLLAMLEEAHAGDTAT